MKIFLIYLVINSPQDRRYNYGLGYIAAVLKKAGHNVIYIAPKDKNDVLTLYKKIKIEKPSIVAFSSTTSQFNYLKDIVKEIGKISNAFIVCGGTHPTLKPECILEVKGLDAIIRGEGEFPMLELADALENKKDPLKIKNFWFKKKNKIIKNEFRPLIRNLDELPFPDKGSLDYQKVIDEEHGWDRFIFSRGCTFECTYCSNKALSDLYKGNYFRLRSPQKAIEEIELDAAKYKFDRIFLDDDTISLDKKWFYEFFKLYKKTFEYPFGCNIRPGAISSDMIRLLKEAGAEKVNIGIEHGNEIFRKIILKRYMTNKQIIETFRLCNKYGMVCGGQIMVGFPFETKNIFLDTVKLCRKLPLKKYSDISIFYPYPGTELGELCEKNNWLPNKKYYREREEAIINYPNFKKEEIQTCAEVYPILIMHKFIPLIIPFKYVIYLQKIIKGVKKLIHTSKIELFN